MEKRKCFLAAVLTVVLLCTGCGRETGEPAAEKRGTEKAAAAENRSEEDESLSVIAILKARNSLHWHFVMEGMEQTARKKNVDLRVIWPEKETDTAVQERMIQDALRAAPDVILLAPDDSARVEAYAERIQRAGIHLIYVDENGEDQTEVPYVGSDNYHAGELAARSMQEGLSEGSVAYIGGSQKQQVHYLRGNGFRETVEQMPELAFTALKEVPDCSIAGGKRAMEQLLQEHPEVKGVFCASALLCMGAQEACQNAGRTDVVLVGMDTQSDVLTALKNGRIHAVISQSGYDMGCRAIELAVRQQQGQEIPLLNYIDNEIISKENVNDYLDAFVMEGRE